MARWGCSWTNVSFLAAGDNRKLRTCAATRPLSIVGFLLSPPAPSVFRPARLASEYTRAYWKVENIEYEISILYSAPCEWRVAKYIFLSDRDEVEFYSNIPQLK